MAKTRIRLLHNFRDRTPLEMTYFLEPGSLHLIHNRKCSFYVAVGVTDLSEYLRNQVCVLKFCPAAVGEDGKEYDFHAEIDDVSNLRPACAALVAKYCPVGYKFYEVGIAARKKAYESAGSDDFKYGNIEIQYCPGGYEIPARDAAGHRDKPDYLICINVHLNPAKSHTPGKDAALARVVEKFTTDFRDRALKGVRDITLDSHLGVRRSDDGVDVVDEGDPKDPCRGRCFSPPHFGADSKENIEKYKVAWERVNRKRQEAAAKARADAAAAAKAKAAPLFGPGGAGSKEAPTPSAAPGSSA